MDTKKVFVVGFAPTKNGGRTVGGFDWFTEYSEARARLLEHTDDGQGFDLVLRELSVPSTFTNDEISSYIDSNPYLWSVPFEFEED